MTTYSCQLLLYFVTLGVFSIQGIQGASTPTTSMTLTNAYAFLSAPTPWSTAPTSPPTAPAESLDAISAERRARLHNYLTTPNPVHWLVMAHGKTFTLEDVAKVPSLAHAPDTCSLPSNRLAVMSLCRWGDSLIGTGDATDVQHWADTMRTMRPSSCREGEGKVGRVEGALREHFVRHKAYRDGDEKYHDEVYQTGIRPSGGKSGSTQITEAEIEARRRILGVLLEEASGGNGDLAAKIDAEMERLNKIDAYLAEGDSTYK